MIWALVRLHIRLCIGSISGILCSTAVIITVVMVITVVPFLDTIVLVGFRSLLSLFGFFHAVKVLVLAVKVPAVKVLLGIIGIMDI